MIFTLTLSTARARGLCGASSQRLHRYLTSRAPFRIERTSKLGPPSAFLRQNGTVSSSPVPKTWVDYFPTKVRPYLYLTRIDKPIGTLLLYYPCSEYLNFPDALERVEVLLTRFCSVVNHHGILCPAHTPDRATDVPQSIRHWCTCYAGSWVHYQRHVG